MIANRWWLAAAVIGFPTVESVGIGQVSATDVEALRQQIDSLEQKVKVLERKRELDQDASVEKAKTATSVSIGASGFQVRSADTNFILRLRGYVQADARFYPNDYVPGGATDTFLLRRVRPIFEGTLFEKYDYRVMLDFGSGASSSAANNAYVFDAYLNARFLPEFQVQVGKFKEPVGLERLQSGANLLFVERGFPNQLVPNRDVGLQVHGDIKNSLLTYAVGIFNGTADGGSSDFDTADDDKDLAGRLFAHPFKDTEIAGLRGLGIGVAGTWGKQEGALRTYVSPGQQRFFGYRTGAGTAPATANVVADGAHWRVSPQAYYYWGPFGALADYVISDQEVRRDDGARTSGQLRHSAWQIAASYFLTGEENSWKAVTPRSPLNPATGGWGAWEVTGRFGQLDIDNDAFPLFANPATSASLATSWGVGINWHLNRNVKVNLNYEQARFRGGDGPLLDQTERVILTRAQVAW
jgi:phosphate-selective porin OprO/OprP